MSRFFFFIRKFKLLAISLLAISFSLMLYYIAANINLDNNITSLLTGDKNLKVLEKVGVLDQLIFDISAAEKDLSKNSLIRKTDPFVKDLEKSGLFKSINYKLTATSYKKFLDLFFDKRYNLMIDEIIPKNSVLTDEKFLQQKLIRVKAKLLSSFDSIVSKEYLIKDPLELAGSLLKTLFSGTISYKVKVLNNVLFSQNEKHILVITKPAKKSFNLDFSEKLIREIEQIEKNHPEIRVKALGGHLYTYTSANLIKNDLFLITVFSVLGIFLLYFFSFKKLKPLLISFVPIIFGIVTGLFAVILLFKTVFGITIVLGAMLIGVGIDYVTHYLVSYSHKKNSLKSITAIHKSLFYGYLTTGVIVLIFYLSQFRFFKEISVFFFFGISASYLLTVMIIPQIKFRGIRTGPFLNFFEKFISYSFRRARHHKKKLLAILIFLGLFFAYFAVTVRFDNNLQNMNYVDPDLKKVETELSGRFGDISTSNLIVSAGGTLEQALQLNDRVYQELSVSKKDSIISSFYNTSLFLPSIRKQKKNISRIQSRDWQEVFRKVQKISAQIGFKSDTFQPFFQKIQSLGATNDYIQLGDYTESIFSSLINQFIISSNKKYYVLSYFKAPEITPQVKEMIERINKIDANVYYINQVSLFKDIILRLNKEMIELTVITLIVIFLVLLIHYRNLHKSFLAIFPTILGIIISIGFLNLIGISLNIMSFFSIILLIGIGLDYGIFVLDSVDNPNNNHISQAISLAALSTIISFGMLIFSKNGVLSSIGIIIFIGISTTMLSSIFIIPLLAKRPVSSKKNSI
jgi:predicted exporter